MNKADINECAKSQSPPVRKWLENTNKFMLDNNCRVIGKTVSNSKRTDSKFTYTSKKSKKTVCIINIGTSGCYISMRANHFIHPNDTITNNILDELPKDMFDFVIKGAGCAACLNSDLSMNINHNCCHGHAETFTYKGQKSFRCPHYGYNFDLNQATEYETLTKWIEYELVWKPE